MLLPLNVILSIYIVTPQLQGNNIFQQNGSRNLLFNGFKNTNPLNKSLKENANKQA
jgi:hypothetical protein